MKIALFSRGESQYPAGELRELFATLDSSGLVYVVNSAFADVARRAGVDIAHAATYDAYCETCAGARMVVSYGGDGTFLDCVREVGRYGIPVLGVNSGRLGFLANVPKSSVGELFGQIKRGEYSVRRSSLLEVSGDFSYGPEYPFAFNEFSLQREGTGMIGVETYIDGEMVATYWGDGVILSTPAGSTAYSLSVGGPIVTPECQCMVIAPIAPHNLTMRPVVIPDRSHVEFRLATREGLAYAALDNANFKVGDGARFTVKKAENSVFLVKMQNISFYDTLRNKMLWGIDRRDEQQK